MSMPPFYIVSNGRLVLHLERDEAGGYVVTSPFHPELVTEADTIEEAFIMAEDALQTLADAERTHPRVSPNGRMPKPNSPRKRRKAPSPA